MVALEERGLSGRRPTTIRRRSCRGSTAASAGTQLAEAAYAVASRRPVGGLEPRSHRPDGARHRARETGPWSTRSATAVGREPDVVAGKPYRPLFDETVRRIGSTPAARRRRPAGHRHRGGGHGRSGLAAGDDRGDRPRRPLSGRDQAAARPTCPGRWTDCFAARCAQPRATAPGSSTAGSSGSRPGPSRCSRRAVTTRPDSPSWRPRAGTGRTARASPQTTRGR